METIGGNIQILHVFLVREIMTKFKHTFFCEHLLGKNEHTLYIPEYDELYDSNLNEQVYLA